MKELSTSNGPVFYGQIPFNTTKIEVVNNKLYYNTRAKRTINYIDLGEGEWTLLCIVFHDGKIRWVRDRRNTELASMSAGLSCSIKEGNKIVCLTKK